ncbi:Ger(x)C family spore germination protein [Paenibacillus sp. J5C_2022]|uniref:Ger(x)C family spore germination protein n=1 Tax=Paenibacillus sp. J5C2022 TaxID=2977129 RepID=UPI0021D0EA10|nr:Ger(x)C family spore germination protein [Paenibacillus sp. J5C2022]MCU6711262.1 Ger(x)C family spore germination protein [Paenibacillus sp. J5C2022]
MSAHYSLPAVRIAATALALCIGMTVLTGCWSASDVQNKSYVKALGIDYEDGEFIVYAQFLDFTSIAKSESGGRREGKPSTWVGRGKGKTINMASDQLYNTSQIYVTWGHISALVFTERALKAKGFEMIEMVNRFPEIRYNTWIYSTQSDLLDILSTEAFFNMTSLLSILHEPMPNYKQNSTLPPIEMFKFIARYNEPDQPSYMPSISLNQDQWRMSKKPAPQLMLNGAYFESHDGSKTFISKKKLEGYQWMQKETNRAPLTVEKNGIVYANLSLGRPSVDIRPVLTDGKARFHITVGLIGAMYEYNEPISYEEMISIAEKAVAEQIERVYLEGVRNGVDLFQLGRALRLKSPVMWKQLTDNGNRLLVTPESIEKLTVHIDIPYNGKYKRLTD